MSSIYCRIKKTVQTFPKQTLDELTVGSRISELNGFLAVCEIVISTANNHASI
jgi:hypothetical protein